MATGGPIPTTTNDDPPASTAGGLSRLALAGILESVGIVGAFAAVWMMFPPAALLVASILLVAAGISVGR